MTQTNDPPLISSLELIPDAAEKADLDAPNTSGGKLVIGQAPNITITETTVVADAAERLALDVQEGDIAIQTNVSTSFIFTGGDNVAPNWETLDFDAVGAIDGEDINPRDITPRDITATGDISLQDLTVAGAINGADTSTAAAGEALTSDGTGGFSFASAGGIQVVQNVANLPQPPTPPNQFFVQDDAAYVAATPSGYVSYVNELQYAQVSGGETVTSFTDSNFETYQIHAFESVGSHTLTVDQLGKADVAVVAGGGGGVGDDGGGGGAGGVVVATDKNLNNSTVNITVGDGGAGGNANSQAGFNGDDSTFADITAIGGSGGGTAFDTAPDGGSGGGGRRNFSTRSFSIQTDSGGGVGFGNDGGQSSSSASGGGGGAITAGQDASGTTDGDGGDGIDLSDTFGTQFGVNGGFAGGGGGGGAGNGGLFGTDHQQSGQDGTGAGAGGGSNSATGGSGIVLVRVKI